jgi:(+)-trans-carveol dehydrogenase
MGCQVGSAMTANTRLSGGFANIGHYAAAKSGLLGLMRTLANELGPHMIRVNCILPTRISA